MFFHFRLYEFRWDLRIEFHFGVFILVWKRKGPKVKNVFNLLFRFVWNFQLTKPEVTERSRMKTLYRKFRSV